MLAWLILTLSTNESPGKPLGRASVRRGVGPPLFLFNLIDLALLAVPQGGAMNVPTTRGLSNHLRSKVCPLGVVKSIKEMGAQQFLGLRWSTPNADDSPKCLRQELTLAVPAKISITIASESGRPLICETLFSVTKRHLASFLGSCGFSS